MRFFRPERLSSLIRERLSWLLLKEIEVPSALITLTEVKVQKDLSRAVAKFSVFPSERAGEILKILEKRAPQFQFMLMREMSIKPMPQIVFEIDRGLENAAKVEKALLEDNNGKQ